MGLFSATTTASDRSTTPTLRRGGSPSSNDDIISPLLADASSTGSDDTSSSSDHHGLMMFKDVEMNAVAPAAKTTTTTNTANNSTTTNKGGTTTTTVASALQHHSSMGSGHHHHNVLKHKNSNLNLEHVANVATAAKSSSSEPAKALWACGLYSFCSVSMILVNKSLASSYNHYIDGDLNILLVVIQAVVAVLCVESCKHLGWVEYPNFSMETAKQWAPVNLFFCAMLFTGMASLSTNSVPMVTVFKNISNIMTTTGDYIFFGNRPEPLVMAAFGVMLTGAVAAAWNDISLTPLGLFWMLANCASTAGYVLYMKFATQQVQLSKFGMVFYNNILCTIFLLPVAFVLGQVKLLAHTDDIHTFDYAFKNVFAGLVGFFLNFASLNCVQVTGPTTYAIVGSLNKIPVAFLGYILFDSVIDFDTWCYIAVSMFGGFLYSYAEIQKANNKNRGTKGSVRKN